MTTVSSLLREILSIIPNRADAMDVAAFLLNVEYEQVPLLLSKKISPDEKTAEVISKLKEGVPPAYITNRRHFYGREFYVNENVLIPRFETEILVEKAVELAPKKNPRVLDLCTGSGCILLSVLAEIEGATGIGVDISPEALAVAKENSKCLSLEDRAEFVQGDVLGELPLDGGFDMVLCNPPYVTEQEYKELEKSVMYEPVQALVAEDEGLVFYKKLIDIVPELCNKNWVALAEIGAGQFNALSSIFSGFSAGSEHRFYCDLSGMKRVLFWKSWS
jgi:release factor glutamine methyltransferase